MSAQMESMPPPIGPQSKWLFNQDACRGYNTQVALGMIRFVADVLDECRDVMDHQGNRETAFQILACSADWIEWEAKQ